MKKLRKIRLQKGIFISLTTITKSARQVVFYVTFFTIFILSFIFNIPPGSSLFAVEYSSEMIEKEAEKNIPIKTYYHRQIDHLRKAVKPRLIRFVDANGYNRAQNMVTEGILFTFEAPTAKNVFWVGNFSQFKRLPMTRNQKGVWFYVLKLEEIKLESLRNNTIYYKFLADGLFEKDHTHDNHQEDLASGLISYFYIPQDWQNLKQGVILLNQNIHYGKEVVFRLYAPQATFVALISNFNRFNPSFDRLEKKADGYFEIRRTLAPGEYVYLYNIDGENSLDQANYNLRQHPIYGRVNYIKVE